MSLWSRIAAANLNELCLVKGAASRMEDLPYSWFHYRPIQTTILLQDKYNTFSRHSRPFPHVIPDLIGNLIPSGSGYRGWS